jgi:hypothetical protein
VESHLRQREGVRGPLNRIADAAKMRREPVFGLSVSKMRSEALFLEQVGRLYKISKGDARAKARRPRRESVKGGGRDALNGVWERRPERGVGTTPKTASNQRKEGLE